MEAVVRRESMVNGVGSLALILPLLFVVFRSVRLVMIGLLPSALSFVIVLGVLGYVGSTLSAAAAGASAMLFGLGVDGVVLLYVTHCLALEQHRNASAAIRAMASPAASMLLGMWTDRGDVSRDAGGRFPKPGAARATDWREYVHLRHCDARAGSSCDAGAAAAHWHSLNLDATICTLRARPSPLRAGHGRNTDAGVGVAATALRVNPTLERLRSVTAGATFLEEVTDTFDLPSDVTVLLQRGRSLNDLLEENRRLVETVRQRVPSVPVQSVSALLPPPAVQLVRS